MRESGAHRVKRRAFVSRARALTVWTCLIGLLALLSGARSLVLCVHPGGRIVLERASESLLCCNHRPSSSGFAGTSTDECVDTPLLRSLETTSKSPFELAALPANLPAIPTQPSRAVVVAHREARATDFQRLRRSVVLQR